ncbi:ABC transporter substrate-binding protein [Aquamicrobium sp. LC103]|uniref:ABC transporter substrate-binding protein n=1 Tax=Aquamicrobium sp. LC103 TaxID=1120658 RepID=UPI001FEDFD92|nr:ABC transporter substrate-binding protein [Aquamicrobium sp. LC103]
MTRMVLAAALFASMGTAALAQAKTDISITRQPGILYLASHVMETQDLIEKHAAKAGLDGVTVEWRMFSGGGAQTDALLAGQVDVVNTGTGNLLLLWDRTNGNVKGITASSAQPALLVSVNPDIKSLEDFGADDRIAVPTVGVSTQAILLQMAAAEMFGEDQIRHFDPMTVQMGHPDALAALSNSQHEVRNHFSSPPFQYIALKNGAHQVASSRDIIGGPLTQATFFTTVSFADGNPVIVQAIRDATEEAIDFINEDIEGALQMYKDISGDQTPLEDLIGIMQQPHMMDFIMKPQGTMRFAEHLHKIGTLTKMPESWTDYYLPASADLDGN